MRGLVAAVILLVSMFCAGHVAAEPRIPSFWDGAERLTRPDLSARPRLRFLVTTDFAPFSFLDREGRLTGFHVDLARAICVTLEVLPRCEIQAIPFAELEPALLAGNAEAIVAGVAVTSASRQRLAFTRPYMKFPARFAMPRAGAAADPVEALSGKQVGVMAGSAHEAMLRSWFPEMRPVTYSRSSWLYEDLRNGRTDAIFGDGMRIAFWLGSSEAAACCRFAGGAYLSSAYLGEGLAIAVAPEEPSLAPAFDYALRELQVNGGFAELYLRYFPVSFY